MKIHACLASCFISRQFHKCTSSITWHCSWWISVIFYVSIDIGVYSCSTTCCSPLEILRVQKSESSIGDCQRICNLIVIMIELGQYFLCLLLWNFYQKTFWGLNIISSNVEMSKIVTEIIKLTYYWRIFQLYSSL